MISSMKVLLVGYTIVIVVGLLQPHPWLHKCSRSRLFWGVRAFGRHGCPRRFRRQCRTTTPVIPSFATRTTTTTHGLVRPAGSVWHRTKIHTNSHHQSPLAELAVPIDTDTSDDASVYQTVVEPAAAAAATQPLVPPLDPNNTTTARTRIPELIEVAFVHACMQLAQGYVDVLKLLIVAIKASYEQQQQHGSVDALIDSVNACPVQTANRALTGEEVQLRTLWIEAVYLMLHHVNHPRSNKTDDDSDTTSPLYNVNNDTARRWDDKEKAKTDVPTVANGVNSNNAICDCSVFIPILPRLVDLHQEQKQQQQQHQSGEKKGGQLPKHVTLELIRQLTAMGNLPPATTTMDKDMAIAVLSQTIQVMWYTLVVLDEEQYANSSSDINVKPKAPSSS